MAFCPAKKTGTLLDASLYNFFIKQLVSHMRLYGYGEILAQNISEQFLYSLLEQSGKVKTVKFFSPHSVSALDKYAQGHACKLGVVQDYSVSSCLHEVQLITLLERFFHEVCRLNSFVLELNFFGCLYDRERFLKEVSLFLAGIKTSDLCQHCAALEPEERFSLFSCVEQVCKEISKQAPCSTEYLCADCFNSWQMFQDNLELLSIAFSHNPLLFISRAEKSSFVFAFSSGLLTPSALFCSGERQELKGKKGLVHADISIEQTVTLLKTIKDRLPIAYEPAAHAIIPLGQEQIGLGLLLADELRAQNLCVDILFDQDVEHNSVERRLAKARAQGAAYALVLGVQEQEAGTVLIYQMMSGSHVVISQINAAEYLKNNFFSAT